MRLTNREVRSIHAALSALSARVLPTIASDLKVATLIRAHFSTPYAATEAALHALVRDLPAPDSDATQLPIALAEAREARFRAEVLDAECLTEFNIPETLYIVEADLPKALSGKDGEANRTGVASIVVALGALYKA